MRQSAWGCRSQRLIVATNVNDILHRTLQTGRYEVRGVTPTTSPSMDIQVSSNFERLLFEMEGRDAGRGAPSDGGARPVGRLSPSAAGARDELAADFASGSRGRSGDRGDDRAPAPRRRHPHRSAHRGRRRRWRSASSATSPMITMATAHPAKFPDAVEAASGERPELPEWARSILSAEEHYSVLPNDLAAIEQAIESAASRASR